MVGGYTWRYWMNQLQTARRDRDTALMFVARRRLEGIVEVQTRNKI